MNGPPVPAFNAPRRTVELNPSRVRVPFSALLYCHNLPGAQAQTWSLLNWLRMQEALARAKLRLGKGRTTILDDFSGSCAGLEGAHGNKAQNALALISDYGMDSDEDDEDAEDSDTAVDYGFQKGLGTEDPLASFFDELQHEGLLDEEHAQRPGGAGMSSSCITHMHSVLPRSRH